jgi:hypothetical protein
MPLRLNGSTSGYTELSAPAVAGSNTLTLPTGNGTSGQVLTTNGSGALSWALPGKVIKVQHFSDAGSSTTSTSYVNANVSQFSFTPLSTSSTLILIANFNAQIANVLGVNAQSAYSIGESSTAVGSAYTHRAFSGSGDIGLQSMPCIQLSLSNTATTARNFTVMHLVNAGGQTSTVAGIRMTIMEVAS